MATSVEDIVNQSLRAVGSKRRIGAIYEGSEGARTALELYGQTRDELLREMYPEFARRANIALTLLKGPPPPGGYNPAQPWGPTYAPPGWLYEYAYPVDCLDVRAIRRPPGLWPSRDPKPAVWRVDNDNTFNPARKVVLTNVAGAIITYCAQVVDPGTWEPLFTAEMVAALAKKFAVPLAGSLDVAKGASAEEMADAGADDRHRG
jgi:hypothetical protein